jgi:dTDP-D-glucose 4,6-dehydratase
MPTSCSTGSTSAEPVVNLDKLTTRGISAVSRRCATTRHVFVRGDIGDRARRCAAALHRPRAIVNFAPSVDRSIHGPAALSKPT